MVVMIAMMYGLLKLPWTRLLAADVRMWAAASTPPQGVGILED
jgi:hypothetical protein